MADKHMQTCLASSVTREYKLKSQWDSIILSLEQSKKADNTKSQQGNGATELSSTAGKLRVQWYNYFEKMFHGLY